MQRSAAIGTLTLLVLLATLVAPVGAQGGDTPALVARVRAGLEAAQAYTNGTVTLEGATQDVARITLDETTQLPMQEAHNYTAEIRFERDANGQPVITEHRVVNVMTLADEGMIEYSLEADLHLAEGALTVTATRSPVLGSELPENLPPLPEADTVIEDPAAWPALDPLPLTERLNAPDQLPLFDPALPYLLDYVSESAVESSTLEDGTEVDVITLTLRGADLGAALSAIETAQGDPAMAAAFTTATDLSSYWTLTFALDDEGQIVQTSSDMQYALVDVNLHALDPDQPEGARMTRTALLRETRTIQVDED